MARTKTLGEKTKPRRRRHEVRHACGTNWNNNLREIASLLPISDTMNGRRRTKKETLVHMLWYFEYLQTQIESLQDQLPQHCLPVDETESESDSEESMMSEPETFLGATQNKSKHGRFAGQQKRAKLANGTLHSAKRTANRSQKNQEPFLEEMSQSPLIPQNIYDWMEPLSDPESVSISFPDSVYNLSLLHVGGTANRGHCSACEGRTSSEDGSPGQFNWTPPAESTLASLREHVCGLVQYSEESESACSSGSTPLLPQMPSFGSGQTLNLSPSLLSSPTRGVTHELLPQGEQNLHSLFEDVWVTSEATASKEASLHSSQPRVSGRKRGVALMSSQSDEEEVGCDDVTWTPKLVKMRQRRKPRGKATVKAPTDAKKKCVNGFIMFCRINRKLYLQSRPGTPSTVVTKALANIWHRLPKDERRIYCLKARRYSFQENRNVRVMEEEQEESEGEDCIPSPFHLLLADRHLGAIARGEA